jgi:hypothetical protein
MDLKPYNEQEFNRLCAEFLGWKQNSNKTTFYVDKNDGRHIYEMHDLKFHSDWNWIMEVKNKICQLNLIDEFNTSYDSVSKGWHCQILPAYKNSFNSFYGAIVSTEKEAVVQAIWQFLNWYNKQKQ